MAVRARSLDSYFKTAATATINLIGDDYVTRIETDDGWYVEPPPANSLMEAIRQIKCWAGTQFDVAVIEDLENTELAPVPVSRREHGRGRRPKDVVRQARETPAPDKQADARRRMRRCA